jgi:gas vesicle protein
MSDDHRNRFLWFLAGLSVGAVTVALYAPKSGVETRRALRSKAEQSRNRLRHHANRVREQASDWADRSRDFLNRRKNQVKRVAKVTPEAPSDIGDAAKKAV